MKKLIAPWLMFAATVVFAQNPQSQQAPIFPANAKYSNGIAPGYAPCGNAATNCTAVTGLNLQVGPGTVNCGGKNVEYAGGILTLTASATNYLYLNTAAICTPALSTSLSTAAGTLLATIVAGSSSITSLDDNRTPFMPPSAATLSAAVMGTDSSSVANVYTVALSPTPASIVTGLTVNFLPHAGNAITTPTLAVAPGSATVITKQAGAALAANDMLSTVVAHAQWNGSGWTLVNPQTSSAGGLGDPGANGLVVRTALNTTGVATGPQIAVVLCPSGTGFIFYNGSTTTCQTPSGTLPNVTAVPFQNTNLTVTGITPGTNAYTTGPALAGTATPDLYAMPATPYANQATNIAACAAGTVASCAAALTPMNNSLLSQQAALNSNGIIVPTALQTSVAGAATAGVFRFNPTGASTCPATVSNILPTGTSTTFVQTVGGASGFPNFNPGGFGFGIPNSGWCEQGSVGNGPSIMPTPIGLPGLTYAFGGTVVTSTSQITGSAATLSTATLPRYKASSTSWGTGFNVGGFTTWVRAAPLLSCTTSGSCTNPVFPGNTFIIAKSLEIELGVGFAAEFNTATSSFVTWSFPTYTSNSGINGAGGLNGTLTTLVDFGNGTWRAMMNDGSATLISPLMTSTLSATSASAWETSGSINYAIEEFGYIPGVQLTQPQVAGMYCGFLSAGSCSGWLSAENGFTNNAFTSLASQPAPLWNTHTFFNGDPFLHDSPFITFSFPYTNGGNFNTVTSLTLTNAGTSGYSTQNNVPTTTASGCSGNGQGVLLNITASGGVITGATIANPGASFSVGCRVFPTQTGSSADAFFTVGSINPAGNLSYYGQWSQSHAVIFTNAPSIRFAFSPGLPFSDADGQDATVRVGTSLANMVPAESSSIQNASQNSYMDVSLPGTGGSTFYYVDVNIGAVLGNSAVGFTAADLYGQLDGMFLNSFSIPNNQQYTAVPVTETGNVTMVVTDSILCSGFNAPPYSSSDSFCPMWRYGSNQPTPNIAAIGFGGATTVMDFNTPTSPSAITTAGGGSGFPASYATTWANSYVTPLETSGPSSLTTAIIARGINDFVHLSSIYGSTANCVGIEAYALKNAIAALKAVNSSMTIYIPAILNNGGYTETGTDACTGDSYTTTTALTAMTLVGGVWTSTAVAAGTVISGASSRTQWRIMVQDLCLTLGTCTYLEDGPGAPGVTVGAYTYYPPDLSLVLPATATVVSGGTGGCNVGDKIIPTQAGSYGGYFLVNTCSGAAVATVIGGQPGRNYATGTTVPTTASGPETGVTLSFTAQSFTSISSLDGLHPNAIGHLELCQWYSALLTSGTMTCKQFN